MEDELESLRKKSTRSSTIYEEMDAGGNQAPGLQGFMAGLTPGQRLLLSFLFFINVLALGVACLVITGILTF
jgi:hypothetical protein